MRLSTIFWILVLLFVLLWFFAPFLPTSYPY